MTVPDAFADKHYLGSQSAPIEWQEIASSQKTLLAMTVLDAFGDRQIKTRFQSQNGVSADDLAHKHTPDPGQARHPGLSDRHSTDS